MHLSNCTLRHQETRREFVGIGLLWVTASSGGGTAKSNPSMLKRVISRPQEMRNLVHDRESSSLSAVRRIDQDDGIMIRLFEQDTSGVIAKIRILNLDTYDTGDPPQVYGEHATPPSGK